MNQQPTRDQLTEARAKIRRQLDILGIPSNMGFDGRPDKKVLIATLKVLLDKIDEAIAELDGDQRKPEGG